MNGLNLFTNYMHLGKFEESEEYFLTAIKTAKELKDEFYVTFTKNMLINEKVPTYFYFLIIKMILFVNLSFFKKGLSKSSGKKCLSLLH
ncbi:hypothetical protein ETL58_10565 [Bacillus subtilis]|nr:hypothetical protein CWT11_15490 [Bacillus subtilis]QAW41909.1 hypothetical protein ETL58_10565 [Bacillus subtilis]QCY74931.1 hypothetical protein CAH07_10830 [Bacillus subtilis]